MPTNGAALTCDRCERALPRTGRDGAPRFRTIPPFPWASFSHDAIFMEKFFARWTRFCRQSRKSGGHRSPTISHDSGFARKVFRTMQFPGGKTDPRTAQLSPANRADSLSHQGAQGPPHEGYHLHSSSHPFNLWLNALPKKTSGLQMHIPGS